ncbi:MAG: class I mannose-6-phosphate isomerase [Phycisphaerales bacterium]
MADAVAAWGGKMTGDHRLSKSGGFPLLVKFLDACENLSVQVHPSPSYAATHADAHLKTECWYILRAEPDAMIYKGLKPGVTRDSLKAHLTSGQIVGDMIAVPAIPGECHNLPSGTVHALGAGVVVAEVQTPSDTTFRLYDWGRTGREIHVEQALACTDLPNTAPPTTRLRDGERSARLVTTEFFTLDEHDVRPGDAIAIGDGNGPAVLIIVGGSAAVGDLLSSGPRVDLRLGQTCVVPAFNTAWDSVVAGPDGCRVLIARLVSN